MSPNYKKIGSRIGSLRQKNGLTQEQLSEILHINRSHLAAIESGTRHPTLELLLQICSQFNTDLNSLVCDASLSNWIPSDINQHFQGLTDDQIDLIRHMLQLMSSYNELANKKPQ